MAIREVILRYPKDFESIAGEAIMLSQFGFLTQANLQENTLQVSSLSFSPRLEEFFSEGVISELQKNGVGVDVK